MGFYQVAAHEQAPYRGGQGACKGGPPRPTPPIGAASHDWCSPTGATLVGTMLVGFAAREQRQPAATCSTVAYAKAVTAAARARGSKG
ncbi:hypothetical protein B296_00008742 [Ensete ventricosum]|uniref:Uncharacterized protein n=1 Tax=Ensete ventricosum TaxID=4639 RepID=A0A427AAW7_ENSVE|nr:hypothetical protein B296_00008742 [Ensete ventricosum]